MVPIGNVEDYDVHKKNMNKPLTNIQSRERNPNRYKEIKYTHSLNFLCTYLAIIYYVVLGGKY